MKKITLILMGMMLASALFAQTVQVSGVVTDAADGQPLPGVSVVVKESKVAVTADINGRYTVNVAGDATLVFSFVGMKTQEEAVAGRAIINVALAIDAKQLEEVVMVGYVTTKKGAVTGAISTVGNEKIGEIPVGNLTQMLQGQVAGVVAITGSGRPGATATVLIRGVSSINSGTAPLYIIDGLPSSSGEFSAINTNDIESLTILKDASATAIYGSRAANGVILVTTKSGAGKETGINYKGQFGVSLFQKDNFGLMNTQEKLAYEVAMGLWDLSNPVQKAKYDELSQYDFYQPDEMFRNPFMQSHELSFTTNTEKSKTYASASMYKQDGIVERSGLERFTGRLNWEQKMYPWLTITTNNTVGYETNDRSVTADELDYYRNNFYSPIWSAYLLNPYERLRDENGNWRDGVSAGQEFYRWQYLNPLQQLELNSDVATHLNIRTSNFLDFKFTDELTLRSTFGINYHYYKRARYFSPYSAWASEPINGTLYLYNELINTYVQNNVLTYNTTFADKHNVKAYVGTETTGYYYSSENTFMINVSHHSLTAPDAFNNTEGKGFSGYKSEYALVSFFGALNYNYDEKYFADITYREDGCSRFGKNKRWGGFWAVGLAWNMKNEGFLANVDVLSRSKLRFSAGTQGNANINNYASLGLYDATDITYNGSPGSGPSTPANDDLTWERQLSFNVGYDFGFLEDRLTATIEWYRRNTYDMILEVPLSLTSGFSVANKNIGDMYNTGIEFTFNTEIFKSQDWLVSIGGNFSYNKNEITKLFGGELNEMELGDTGLKLQTGHPYGEFYYVRWAGVNPANGDGLWYTAVDGVSDGGIINSHRASDKVMLGKSYLPSYTAGFTLDAAWKGLSISVLFSGIFDKYTMNNNRYFLETSNGKWVDTQRMTTAADFWQKPGDVTRLPRKNVGENIFDDRLVEKQDFVRLKNLVVSYTFNKKWLERTKFVKGLRIYVQGENLLTFTDYKGFDPEQISNVDMGAYPTPRIITGGIDITF
jgi:TonB-linked SusC/RagA family outer membrane protein